MSATIEVADLISGDRVRVTTAEGAIFIGTFRRRIFLALNDDLVDEFAVFGVRGEQMPITVRELRKSTIEYLWSA